MESLSANDPRVVGEFQLRARLGSGGMGQVYLGFSPAGRAVAVKVVHLALAKDPEFLRRFAREVAAARAVSGMYTAPVVAAGLHDDPPWLATAFVPGPSLAEIVGKHGPLPEPAVWRLAAGLAEALQAVHACGLVHRDLKPANVLLAADGPRVIDFGISRALDGTSLTMTGMVVGTPGYMSPEQAEGVPTGPPSDVFSLGCVLAYAATGGTPFGDGSAAAVLYRVVTAPPDLAGVPAGLREVVSACLAKNSAERPGLTQLTAQIARARPAVPAASAASFWPAPVAEVIRTSQPYATPDGSAPVATHTMTAPAGTSPRRYRPEIPRSIRTAARLMYSGASLSLLGMIVNLSAIDQIKAAFLTRSRTAAADRAAQGLAGILAGGVVVAAAVSIALWLTLAAASKRGRSWVPVAGSVLFGINTLSLLGTLGRPGIGATKGIAFLTWLAGLFALIALWRRQSRAWMALGGD
jgi:serine/threonine protein kinase